MRSGDDGIDELVSRAACGDPGAMGELFARFRDRLRTMVGLRLDRRLRGRVDPSDILQEAYLDASKRIGAYVRAAPMPFFLWLRFLTAQRLLDAHRHHLGAKMRAANQEVSVYRAPMPGAASESLAAQVLGQLTAPDAAAIRGELQRQLQEALEEMDALDREVLTLRHFEELNNKETALVLGISKTAASNRYIRALGRLREILEAMGLGGD
ncbi:MAG TPA: sigma-70 family RNA polymerase sigma factor [Tepidisphaeraceae bacterium]|jgi:RNA polymerase sigma-70 factor (ECF subfamily)|nr:sigma-70 family RNA polymerase sigma factor [Tepidisphaeraceae bacterium]